MSSAVRPVEARMVLRGQRSGGPGVEALAREAGVHPELVRRLVALGLLEPALNGRAHRQRFPRDAASRIARAARLRRDLGLNYAGALLACELLDRIDQLERELRRHERDDRQRR